MNITCLSLNALFEQIRCGEHEGSFLILISSFMQIPEIEELDLDEGRIAVFHFIDEVEGEHCIEGSHARQILEIIDKCVSSETDIVVSCDGGVSRSAAIAGFAEVFFCGKDSATSQIFNDPSKSPNELVLSTLLCEFGANRGIDSDFLFKTKELIHCIESNAIAFDREHIR